MGSNKDFDDIQDKLKSDVKAASANVWRAAIELPKDLQLHINYMAPELGKAIRELDIAFRMLFMSAAEPEEGGD